MTGPGSLVSEVRFLPGSEEQVRTGLLGFVSLVVGGLRIDGICLRSSLQGHQYLSYPARKDRSGKRHSVVRPVDDAARLEVEREVLVELEQRRGQACRP